MIKIKAFRIPNVKLKFTRSIIECSMPNTTGHCVGATALRRLGFSRIQVTSDFVKVCKFTHGFGMRYTYPTPRGLAEAAANYDATGGDWSLDSVTLDGRQACMAPIQPRRRMPPGTGRGPTQVKRTASKKVCVRRWKGLKIYTKTA